MRDLGDGRDRGVRAAARRALLERDRRRHARDRVDVGPRQRGQELARVRRERLHEAPLPLGEDDVERERRLARAARPRHDAQLAVRDRARDVLQVVLARVRHRDRVGGSSGRADARVLARSRLRLRGPAARSPVRVSLFATCSGVPSATTRPPCGPPPGPRSMTQSHARMTSRSCSTTTTLAPSSTSACSASTTYAASSAWRPALGSSTTKSVPFGLLARARARA